MWRSNFAARPRLGPHQSSCSGLLIVELAACLYVCVCVCESECVCEWFCVNLPDLLNLLVPHCTVAIIIITVTGSLKCWFVVQNFIHFTIAIAKPPFSAKGDLFACLCCEFGSIVAVVRCNYCKWAAVMLFVYLLLLLFMVALRCTASNFHSVPVLSSWNGEPFETRRSGKMVRFCRGASQCQSTVGVGWFLRDVCSFTRVEGGMKGWYIFWGWLSGGWVWLCCAGLVR